MLEKLNESDILLGIVSNGTKYQMNSIYALRIKEYIKTILISDVVGFKKPDSRIFELAIKELDLQKENVLL